MTRPEPLTTYTIKLTDGDKITVKAHEMIPEGDLLIGFVIHSGSQRQDSGWRFPLCNVVYVATEEALRNLP